ncbi:MAG: HK97 gp10 family phage protein [Tissierellia bacterium]|nr:HK97 gp10 family phage protein [Tissierellia bacterium]
MSTDISEALGEILGEYSLKVGNAINQATEETAKELVQDLKQNSPKKKGKYGKSWKETEERSFKVNKGRVIYNEKHYQLIHLLEFGHATVNGGRVEGRPHVQPAEHRAIKNFEEKIKKGLKE